MSKEALRIITSITPVAILVIRLIVIVATHSTNIIPTVIVGLISLAILLVNIWNEFYRN